MKRLLNIDEIDEMDRKQKHEIDSRNGSIGANVRWAKWRAARDERLKEQESEPSQSRLTIMESRLSRIERELGIPNE